MARGLNETFHPSKPYKITPIVMEYDQEFESKNLTTKGAHSVAATSCLSPRWS